MIRLLRCLLGIEQKHEGIPSENKKFPNCENHIEVNVKKSNRVKTEPSKDNFISDQVTSNFNGIRPDPPIYLTDWTTKTTLYGAPRPMTEYEIRRKAIRKAAESLPRV